MARKNRYQRGSLTVEDGQHKLRYYDTNGKRRTKCLGSTSTTTAAQAKRAADMFLSGINLVTGQGMSRREHSVIDVIQKWRSTVKPALTRPSTIRTTEWVIGKLGNPDGGILDAQLQVIGRQDIQEWLIAHSQSHSPRTLHLMKAVVAGLLSYAVDWGWVLHNPAHGRYRMLPKVLPKQRPKFQPEHADRLLNYLDPELSAMFLIALLTGMRRSELAALRLADIQPTGENHKFIVTISRKWDFNATPRRFGPTKSGKIVEVHVGPLVWEAIRNWESIRPSEGELIFPSRSNADTPADLQNLMYKLKRRCVVAGVPVVTWHDLRSCYTTWCVGAGVNPKVIQAQVGHASSKITMDVYAQLFDRGEVAQTVEGLLNMEPKQHPRYLELVH